MIRVSISLDDNLVQELNLKSEETGFSKSLLTRMALKYYFKEQEEFLDAIAEQQLYRE